MQTIKYSEEFKRDAVALVKAGALHCEVCRGLGVSTSAMSKWVADAERTKQGCPSARFTCCRRRESA
ncbi:transposase [Leucobacter chinensis]|uniref:transposase n=1 Tax=Leucobacter chinensis TaxID=2851010 RepID=UPI00350EA43E